MTARSSTHSQYCMNRIRKRGYNCLVPSGRLTAAGNIFCMVCTGMVFLGDLNAASEALFPARLELDAEGRSVVRHEANAEAYYILYRGTDVTQIVSAVDMALGIPVEGQLLDGATGSSTAFYQVREVPLASPLDTDGDGLDDVWELRFRKPRAALNSADANEDHDGSGSPDLADYQLPIASFTAATSTVIAADSRVVKVAVHFSKPFAGFAAVLLGGTATPVEDYSISGFDPANQTARVAAVGNTATFNITLRDEPSVDPDRYLLLSLLDPATNAPARYRTSQQAPVNHTLRITDGDLATYAGILEFTNQTARGTHPVRLALRSSSGGTVEGYLDATQSPVFRQAFLLPVTASPAGVPLGFPQPLVHQTNSAALRRPLTWTLQFGTASNSQDTIEVPVSLQLLGLSASGQPVSSQGQLRLVRVNSAE
jgi:hypothetical protein